MEQLPNSITITIAVLTVFLACITALKYAVEDEFRRTRLIMTAFFLFIVATLTICFYDYFFLTLPYTIPAGLAGVGIGYFIGVRTEQQKLRAEGIRHYVAHFAHIHIRDLTELNWWTIINFYSVMGALLLINLVGLTTVIFHNLMPLTLITSAFGAFLIGTIFPYLLYLWSIKASTHNKSSTTSDR